LIPSPQKGERNRNFLLTVSYTVILSVVNTIRVYFKFSFDKDEHKATEQYMNKFPCMVIHRKMLMYYTLNSVEIILKTAVQKRCLLITSALDVVLFIFFFFFNIWTIDYSNEHKVSTSAAVIERYRCYSNAINTVFDVFHPTGHPTDDDNRIRAVEWKYYAQFTMNRES
jgi:hypothetical protein